MHSSITRRPCLGTADRIVLLAAVVACAACAEPARAPVTPQPPLGTTHVAPPGTMPPDTRPPVIVAPAPAQRLATVAQELSSQDGTRRHDELVEALHVLADAGAQLAPQQLVEIDAIRRAAGELETSPPGSLQHADYVRYGLDAALRLFAAASPRDPMHLEEYLELVQILKRDVEALDPTAPLLPQHRAVARAFATAARATYVAHGATPPELSASRD